MKLINKKMDATARNELPKIGALRYKSIKMTMFQELVKDYLNKLKNDWLTQAIIEFLSDLWINTGQQHVVEAPRVPQHHVGAGVRVLRSQLHLQGHANELLVSIITRRRMNNRFNDIGHITYALYHYIIH